jgi:hypothetical protein
MGRQPRSTVPTSPTSIVPSTPDIDAVRRREIIYKQQQAANYNLRQNAREGRKWVVSDRVWVTEVKVEAMVTDVLPFPSFQLRTAAGTTIRRNGCRLRRRRRRRR